MPTYNNAFTRVLWVVVRLTAAVLIAPWPMRANHLEMASTADLDEEPSDALFETMPGVSAVASAGRKSNLADHLDMLAKEFSTKPRLAYVHAECIVRVRRQIDLEADVPKFFGLWRRYEGVLLSILDSRWLVSACDTFADHAEDGLERSSAVAGLLFMNTIKLYETERLQTGSVRSLQPSQGPLVPLFDGMTGYVVGRGDMVRNMLDRINSDRMPDCVTVRILRELVRRARTHDTVFGRMAAVHTRDATRF